MALGLSTVDSSQPWLQTGHPAAAALAAAWNAGQPVAEALNQQPGAPVRFVPQSALPQGRPYEAFIFETRCVPTRDNLHDLFNGLCWMQFPQAKLKLNALQAAEIGADGVGGQRGPVRDAITLFDENAALLQAPDLLWDALAARQWQRAFGELRPLWQASSLVIFGHALLEKLVQPYKSITAHVWRIHPPDPGLTALDTWLANDLRREKLAAKPFIPLPVLGVPGWWPPNEHPSFYDDASVFRPEAHRPRSRPALKPNNRSDCRNCA